MTAVDDDAPAVSANTGSTVAEGGTDPLPQAELEYTATEQSAASVANGLGIAEMAEMAVCERC